MKNLYILTLLIATLTLSSIEAKEQSAKTYADSLYRWERFSVNFGGFVVGLSSDINLGSKQLGLGVSVNLEDALGLKTNSLVLRSEVEYAFGKSLRHSGRFSYYGFLRSSNKTLDSGLEIGDTIFPVGTRLESKFNMEIFKLDYAYAFYMDSRVKLSGTFGFFVMPITFSAAADDSKGTSTAFVAPLPVIGLRTNFAVTPKFYIMQNLEVLYLTIGNFKGSMTDINIRAEYKPWNHFGFGLGLNSYQLNLTMSKPNSYLDFAGNIKTGYTGVLLFAKYFF